MDKLGKKKWILIGLGGLVLVLALACGIYFALGGGINAYIDAPADVVEEDLGTYTIPDYEVIDKTGMILAGYRVRLVSVTDPGGGAVDASYGSIMVETPGVYTFVYTADARSVKDVAVRVDFGDRTAPTVSLTGTLPDFFVTGNTYKVPSYTVAGDASQEKCWAKVFYLPDGGAEQEVEVKGNRFQVAERDGKYAIRIHVEDAAGNFNDYEYTRSVDGPEHYDEDTVLYFGEEFGQRQVELLEPSKYTGKFVSRAEAPDRVHGEDTGAYQVRFTGVETQSNEGYIIMKTPAILDVSDSIELEMYVYNDSDADIIMGSRWWNDQTVKKGEWTRLTWPVDGWGGANGNVGTDNIKTIGTSDISGTNIRFIFDYSGEVVPTGTFYLSPMRAVRVHRGPSVLEAGEHVLLDKTECTQGDTVFLRAEEIPGKVVDCFLVDGVPVVGESFIPTAEKHKITVQYTDKLTIEDMTWGERFYDPEWYGNVRWLDGNNCETLGANEGTSWAMGFDVTGGYDGGAPTNQLFNVAVHVGKTHIIEFQINRWTESTCKWNGDGAWDDVVAALPAGVVSRFISASEENPVNVLAIRRENDLYLFVDDIFIGKTSIGDKPIQGDWFGYAARVEQKGIAFPTVQNLKAVVGEERTELVYNAHKYYLDVEDHSALAVIDGDSYRAPAAVLKDIDGNVTEGIRYSLTASNRAGESCGVSGGYVTIPYRGAIGLNMYYSAENPNGKGELHTSAGVTVQRSTGLIMEPSTTAVSTISPHGNTVAYDSGISHGGDSGSIKVTAKAGDVGVCLNMFRFTGYDYADFWVYTERENTMSGAYWLGDTPLKPGEWTRVRIKLADTGVYLHNAGERDFCPNSYHKGQPYVGRLVLRFMGEGSGAGAEFWVSSVQAGVYGPVSVTAKNCSVEKTSYMQGDTITLIPEPPEGMILDYFTVNGEPTGALSFEALDREYVVEAFYRPETTVMGINDFSVPSIGTGENAVSLDSSVRHGSDNGSVKVTVSGGDNFVFLRKFDYTGYDLAEFYVYTESENTTAGVWWLGDTPLRAGKWTRVRIDLTHERLWLNNREINVNGIWPNRDGITPDGNMVVRLFGDGCTEGTQFWISSVTVSKRTEGPTDPRMVVDASVNDYDFTHDAQSAQYTSDKPYDGPDTLVTANDSGSMKITVGGGEASVGVYGAVVDDISGYGQVYYYAYTDAEGIEAGGWWCGDTPIVPGQWTRIVLSKDMAPQNVRAQSIFQDTPDGFAYRIKGGKAGDTVYVTSLYAGDSYKQMPAKVIGKDCSADKTGYAPGETVTLTADAAPEGMAFAYFKVNGKRLEGNTFTVEGGTEYTAEAVFYTLQAKVLDVNTTQMQGISGTITGEYVTDRRYNGGNELVSSGDQGTMKVTVSGADSAICVNNPLLDDIGMYDQVYYYAYTEDSGVVAGGWWCGDTALTPGQWTRVVLPKVPANQYSTTPQNSSGKPIFENGPANFVYRFQNAGDGATVYVTSLYAGPAYEKATVTLDGCTADKAEYMLGDTVNLTVDPPAGQALDYISVNGEIISGLSFTVKEPTNEVKAVYKPADKVLNSAAWASSLGTSNGSTVVEATDHCYGGESSALKVTAAGGDNGVFLPSFDFTGYDYAEFYVYTEAAGAQAGSWWCADTALTAGQWTKVRVPLDHTNLFLKNPTDNGEIKPNQGDKPAPVGRLVARFMGTTTGTEFWVSSVSVGKNSAVSTEPQMVVNANVSADQYSWQHNGGTAQYTTEKPYTGGNALVRGSENGSLKVTVNGAEASVGVYGAVVDSVSQYDQVYFYVYTDAQNAKSGGWWCGDTALTPGQWTRVDLTKAMKPQNVSAKSIFEDTPDGFAYRFMNAPAGTVFYVTSLYAGTPVEQTPVTINKTNCAADQESYYPGQTVILTAQVPEGMVFDYFTVNGEKLAGNTFTVEEGIAYTVDAAYHAAPKKVVEINGAAISAASGTVNGVYVTDKVYDGGNALVRGSEAGSLKVTKGQGDTAICVDQALVSDISMYDQVYYYAYTEDSGVVAGGWWCGDTALTPGQWTRVVLPKVPANSYSTTPWNKDSQSIFENGPANFIYRFQNAEATVYVTSLYAGDAYEQAAVRITPTKCTMDKAAYFPGQTVTLTADAPDEGMFFHHFEVNGEAITGNTFQVESGKTYDVKAVYRAAPKQVFAISGENVTGAGGVSSFAYGTEKVYDGGNALVRGCDSGSMKVTVTGGEAAILVTLSETKDISAYDKLFFYVYTDAQNVKSGSWWCGDTALTPGKWTKVTLTKDMAIYDTNGRADVFGNGLKCFYYRFMSAPSGTVFYVTSLYAGDAYEQTPVTITAADCRTDKAGYFPGQTVTLEANEPAEGMEFDHFTVNGEAISGETFEVKAGVAEYEAAAVYREKAETVSEADQQSDPTAADAGAEPASGEETDPQATGGAAEPPAEGTQPTDSATEPPAEGAQPTDSATEPLTESTEPMDSATVPPEEGSAQ